METIDLLKKLVSINSVFPNEEKISKFLSGYLKDLGFDVKVVLTDRDRPNLVATFGKAKKYLGFYGHMDTVPRENLTDGLNLKIEGKKAYGLGVEDMKGGIAAILKAGEFAKEAQLPLKIILGVDEENISEGAHDLVDSKLLNDIEFLISAENGQIINPKQPFNVVYGRKGRILYKVSIYGKKSHAAEADKGINAIEQAAKFIQALKSLRLPSHPSLGKCAIFVHSIVSFTDSFSVPEICKIRFSLMTNPECSSNDFIHKIEGLANKLNINLRIRPVPRKTPYGESFEVDLSNRFLKLLQRKVFSPNKIIPTYSPSIADENVFANRLNIPVICLGPMGGGKHTKEEWLDLDSLTIVEETYKNIIKIYHESN